MDRFARAGIAALCYDKRGCGASTGDWRRVGFNDLAGDVVAAVHLLQERCDINSRQIGLYGHSQGGYIAPLVAIGAPSLAFIVAADSPGGPAYAQDLYRVRTQLTSEGYSPATVSRAMAFFSLFVNVARTGQGWDRLQTAISQDKNQPWFDEVAPPPRGNWLWAWYQKTGDYDSLPLWEKVHVPVLLIDKSL